MEEGLPIPPPIPKPRLLLEVLKMNLLFLGRVDGVMMEVGTRNLPPLLLLGAPKLLLPSLPLGMNNLQGVTPLAQQLPLLGMMRMMMRRRRMMMILVMAKSNPLPLLGTMILLP